MVYEIEMIIQIVCLSLVCLVLPLAGCWLRSAAWNWKAVDAIHQGDDAATDRCRRKARQWAWLPDHTIGPLMNRIDRRPG